MHIRCPHCHNAVEVVSDSELTAVSCPSCGSAFSLIPTTEAYTPTTRSIAHFELLEQLGTGSFGSVWKARDTQLDRLVAVKIPRRDQIDSADAELFLREARAAAQLRHPQIVAVHEVGREDGKLYIVSDFVPGVTLADRLTAGRLTPREAAELLAQVAAALHHAHEAGVIHRDVKPQNIMLDGEGRPHLMDFGLAKREAGEISMTVDGKILGTAAYMSPEQARGEAHRVDRRTDVYSLGVILFELLTGERPFRGNVRMLLHQVLHDEPPGPRKLNSRVPRDLETICLKCLEKEPSSRYASAADVGVELNRWLAGKPILARPISRVERGWRWCRRHPAVSGLTSGMALLLVLVAVGSLWSAWQIARARDSAIESGNTADRLARQNTQQLIRLYVTNGNRFTDDGDSFGSLPWFTAALRLDSATNGALHRQRIGAVLKQSPSLVKVLRHERPLNDVQISPDGRLVVTVGDDGTARLWRSDTGEPVGQPLTHGEHTRVLLASFSPSGDRLATAAVPASGLGMREVRIFECPSGDLQVALPHPFIPHELLWGRDQKRLVTVSWLDVADRDSYKWAVQLWDTNDGRCVATMVEGSGTMDGRVSARISLDGARLVTTDGDRSARVHDAATGQAISPVIGHDDYVRGAELNDDGTSVATWTSGWHAARSVYTWDAQSGQRIGKPMLHESDLLRVLSGPQRGQITTVTQDGIRRVWDVNRGAVQEKTLKSIAFSGPAWVSPDGSRIATGTLVRADGVARVWELTTGEPATPMLRHPARINGLAFSRDGDLLVTAGEDGTARLWKIDAGPQLVPDSLSSPPLAEGTASWISRDSTSLLTASIEGGLQLWGSGTRQALGPARPWPSDSRRIWVDHTCRHVLLFGDQSLILMDVATGDVRSLDEPTRELEVDVVTFDADSNRVLVARRAPRAAVRVWSIATCQPLTPWLGGQGVAGSCLSPDGTRAVIASADGVQVMDVDTGKPLAVPLPSLAPAEVGSSAFRPLMVAFSPNGRRFVLSLGFMVERDLGRVEELAAFQVFDARLGKPLSPRVVLQAQLFDGPAFSPDGRVLLTSTRILALGSYYARWGQRGGESQTWDADTGLPISQPMRHADACIAAFSPDGSRVVTASEDRTARIWSATSGKALSNPLPHDAWPDFATFSPDGRLVLTANTGRGELRVWDATSGEPVSPPWNAHQRINSPRFDTEQTSVLVSGSRGMLRWNLAPDDRPLRELDALAELLALHWLDPSGLYVETDR